MNKPRPFIHFRQTYEYEYLGVLAIGRFVIPTRVLMPLVGFILVLLIAAAGILHGVTGDGNWWGLVGWYASIVGIIAAIGGAIALVSWMVSDTIYANQEES
ncbi:membrane protein [Microbacterium phage Zooman]|nr:membrane protein [Microbacterium phage Zooman]